MRFEIKTNLYEQAEGRRLWYVKIKTKNARKFELLISDQTLEDMLRGNSAFETDIPVKHPRLGKN